MDLTTLVIILIILYFITKYYGVPGDFGKAQVTFDGYTTTNFDICPSSKAMFEKMKADGVDGGLLRRFVILEDTFLGYERITVCQGKNMYLQASALSQEIKATFMGWDFAYHTMHLKQMVEPLKRINPNLSCMSR